MTAPFVTAKLNQLSLAWWLHACELDNARHITASGQSFFVENINAMIVLVLLNALKLGRPCSSKGYTLANPAF